MRIEEFASNYRVWDWLHAEGIFGEEAMARVMDFVNWIYATPDPEPDPEDHDSWGSDVKNGILILYRDLTRVEFDAEGYADVTFYGQGSPEEVIKRYYQYGQEKDL